MQCSWNILFTAINVLHVVGKQYVKQVDRCPTENEWEEKVKTFTGVCQESGQYHCLRSTNGSWIEACMYKDKIMRDKCLQLAFNGEELIINNAGYDCRSGSDMSCPKLGETYWSNEIYKFSGCFNAGPERTTTTDFIAGGPETQGVNPAAYIVPVVVVILIAAVVIIYKCYKKRNSQHSKSNSKTNSTGPSSSAEYQPLNVAESQGESRGDSQLPNGEQSPIAESRGDNQLPNGEERPIAESRGDNQLPNGEQSPIAESRGDSQLPNGEQSPLAESRGDNQLPNGEERRIAESKGDNQLANEGNRLAADSRGDNQLPNEESPAADGNEEENIENDNGESGSSSRPAVVNNYYNTYITKNKIYGDNATQNVSQN